MGAALMQISPVGSPTTPVHLHDGRAMTPASKESFFLGAFEPGDVDEWSPEWGATLLWAYVTARLVEVIVNASPDATRFLGTAEGGFTLGPVGQGTDRHPGRRPRARAPAGRSCAW